MSGILASGESSSYSQPQLFAGDGDVRTRAGDFASGLNIPAISPIARITASGLLTLWAPGASDGSQTAVGLTCEAVNTTGGAARNGYYISGDFNNARVQWPTATDIQKAIAFDRTAITVRVIGA